MNAASHHRVAAPSLPGGACDASGVLSMIPGLGLVRRTITLALCAGSFGAGMQFAQWGQVDKCLDAGGAWHERGYCEGGVP
jgi:hypothetical protein